MKITKIELNNFKKFSSLTVNCEEQNILTGKNNAGKSTTLDALRIVHDVIKYASRRNAEIRVFEGELCSSYDIAHSIISMPANNLSKNYSSEPACIKVTIENGNQLIVHLQEDTAIKAYFKIFGKPPIVSGKSLLKEYPLYLVVVPTLGPVEENENYLTDKTIQRSENTRTAHRHLRNILIRKSSTEFETFAKKINEAWPNITLEKPEVSLTDQVITMFFSENRIPREIFWSGFGFQIWMQIVLQLMRGNSNATLVLDEPDIYLHPDLQITLVKEAENCFGQVFIATHSLAIIQNAGKGEVLEISDQDQYVTRI